ncbi:hypothetical protein K443DRAFT_96092 [Laccaria amethystina LaAM-08-1]|uniref:DNA mismatch repair protein S5 domain-containing protein n=1 Tax=Laccaria amethystina LaAM-08-1 TaxID=1095629 RepID=A0A0C9WUH8_9AGAR|nr:hypothetical protein K443DRAFT_96092 [Laccaria amethystina LaAM-08-1]
MSSSSVEPRPIRRLQESLINRIAAGEIIHRPASALKELLENSLDAGATSIRVIVKDGGMKLLQIQDNGCGMRKSDLPILAERFTTSKLSTFSDLSRITTYGFRGEALASISHVAHLSVITKTKSDTCAWKAYYLDGALVEPKPGQTPDPKPCAGNDGTIINIEDLFYNTPTRLSSIRSTSEEYARILDVLTKYSVHNPKIAFLCKKAGSAAPDLSTPSDSETSHAIRLLYGHSIAKELINVKEDNDESESWSAESYFTNTNYQAKKTVFLLFINHRLVESPRMKRSLEAVYHTILPKGASPFVYLSLNIDPRAVDVNVHPTKREVHFLNEDAIIERVSDAIQQALAAQGKSRAFEYQVTSSSSSCVLENSKGSSANLFVVGIENKKRTYSQHKVRTSLQDRTLESMFPVVNPAQLEKSSADPSDTPGPPSKSRDVKESECFLTSVQDLRKALVKGKHRQLTEILEKHTFVGIAHLQRCLSLIQYSTKLYLINHAALADELFYQLGVRQFGDFSRLKLEPPPILRDMIEIAVNAEDSTDNSPLSKTQIIDRIVNILMTRREMLAEYFSLTISESGLVESLPLLLRDYIPNLDNLPSFLMRLGPQVDWSSEKECFESFLRELAYFYTPLSPLLQDLSESESHADQLKAERWQIQHTLFPAMRRYLVAPKSLLDRDVVQIANLPDLYKVFERC